jgi:hypothetical protein
VSQIAKQSVASDIEDGEEASLADLLDDGEHARQRQY